MSRHPLRPSALTASLLAALGFLFGALAIPLLTGRIFPFGDMAGLHVPLRFLYQQALQAGHSFLWTSDLGNGLFVHGEGQAGMAHPLHLLLYRFVPLGPALNLEMLSSYLTALAGMWLLLRRLGHGSEASLAGATLFAFSGYNLFHLNHLNLVAVVSHIPWLLYSADLLLTGSTPRLRAAGLAGVSVVLGSQFLLGFPQCVWMGLVVLGWFVLFRLATGAPYARVLLLIAALAGGAMIGGVQVLPTLDAARESYRAVTTMAFRLTFSLHPLNLIQLFSPYTFALRVYAPVPGEMFVHEFAVYNGAVSTLSLFWIAMRWRALRGKPLLVAWVCLAALGVLLSLGRYGLIYPLLAHLPGVSGFRGPTRHIILVHFAFAGMVAAVIEDLMALSQQSAPPEKAKVWPLGIPVALSAAIVLAGLAVARTNVPLADHLRHGAGAAAGLAFIGAGAILMALGARGMRAALPLLMILSALDLSAWGTRYVWAEPPVTLAALLPPAGLPPGSQRGDTVLPDLLRPLEVNRYVLWGLRPAAAYTALVRPAGGKLDRTQWMRVAGVQWAWTPGGWSAVSQPMPRVRLVSDWLIPRPDTDIRAVDVARTALVDVPPGATAGAAGRAEILEQTPGRLRIETDAPQPQLLVLTERFHAGWRATIDDRQVPLIRVNGDYLGCMVPAGRKQVTLVFAPASVRYGLWLSLAGIAWTLLMAWAVSVAYDPGPSAAAAVRGGAERSSALS